jgi:hypothetical protein
MDPVSLDGKEERVGRAQCPGSKGGGKGMKNE